MSDWKRLSAFLFVLLLAFGRIDAAPSRNAVDDGDRVRLPGNVHPMARAEFDIGPVDAAMPLDKIVLSLKRRPGAQAELDRLLQEQQDPNSLLFHHWLTPEEFGPRFGISDAQINQIIDWLQGHGLSVEGPAKGKGWIIFSGSAAQVEETFRTKIHEFFVNGELHHANSTDPSIPRALSDVVAGVASLHDFRSKPMSHRLVRPEATFGSTHWLAPADFATIYNVKPLYATGINGSGQSIAVVARSNLKLSDVQGFRSNFGLPANDPQLILNGTDPGIVSDGEESEVDLDTEWTGAVAPNATIKVVISKSTQTTEGALLSAQYVVNNNLSPVISMSFGVCESDLGAAGNLLVNNLWSQAASQGISVFVSSGDSGASGCDEKTASTGTGKAVNGFCSTPFSVCVGGTLFEDTANPDAYWFPTNDPTTLASAKSFIPEQAWNESGNATGGTGLLSTGGGVSTVYSKPAWQVAPGVPADGKRDVPDVALTASGHNSYIIFQEHVAGSHTITGAAGTSASAPAFAALMALIVQKTGARQGNPNLRFYQLGNAQYSGTGSTVFSTGSTVFHDVTSGNNSVPGVTGFTAGAGYDQTTGLGSVDATALANNWVAPIVPCVPNATTLCLLSSRFKVTVTWKNQHTNPPPTGVGMAVVGTDQTGRFWFFDPTVIELLVKIIDGRGVNASFWVFYGALSDVEYTIIVTDTATGKSKSYHNAPGIICGNADIHFSTTASSSVEEEPPPASDSAASFASPTLQSDISPEAAPCSPTSGSLCLLSHRFRVSVSWIDQHTPGHHGDGTAVPSTDQTGYFFFFDAAALELAVKMIDGRAVNGKFWAFYGALSDVEYTITITDTLTGAVKIFHNIPGNICGDADIKAFGS